MTSKERVLTAFSHKEADCVPVGEMHIMSPIASELLGREAITGEGGWTIRKQMELCRAGRRDEYVERLKVDTLDAFRAADMDLICMELDPPRNSSVSYRDVTDNTWVEVDETTGHWAKFAYDKESDTAHEVDSTEKGCDDFSAIEEHLDALENGGCDIDDSRFESTEYVTGKAGRDMFVMAKIPNLIPSGRSWYTNFMEMVFLDPDLTQRLCDVYLRIGLKAAEKYARAGVDCVMIATDWSYNTGPILPPDKIRQYMIPQVNAIADYCHKHGVLVLKHTDGNIMEIADDFFGMNIDAYQGIEPNAGMDIALIKRLYGHRVTLMGNVDCGRVLAFGSREELIEATKNCIRAAAVGGGYILGSNNTIAHPVTADNFRLMVETARQFGVYPISWL